MALVVSGITELFESARTGNRRSLSKLLTEIESGASIEAPPSSEWTLGVTGPPGVGKSSLIGRMVEIWSSKGESVAILAVDPSSPISGGALLADRIRMGNPESQDSVFVRSLASGNHPGGLMPYLGEMCSVLSACGWSRVIIETVGAGQSEFQIIAFADRILLIDGPDRGDIIQAEKAGILELADVIAINKADLPNSQAVADSIKIALQFGESDPTPIHTVSAIEGTGIGELISEIENLGPDPNRKVLRFRELLISSWNAALLTHPQIDLHLEKLCDGSITVSDAIQSMGSLMDFGDVSHD